MFGSELIRLAHTDPELQKLWPPLHKESNDVKVWGLRRAKISAEVWRRRCDHKSEFPHTLLLLTSLQLLFLPSSVSASLGQRRHILNPLAISLPAVHQQKTINCFIGWSFSKAMSSALPIPGIPPVYYVCVQKRASCQRRTWWFPILLLRSRCPTCICHAVSKSVSVGWKHLNWNGFLFMCLRGSRHFSS